MSTNKSFKLKFLVYILGLSTTTLLATGVAANSNPANSPADNPTFTPAITLASSNSVMPGVTLAKDEDGPVDPNPVAELLEKEKEEFVSLNKTVKKLKSKSSETYNKLTELKKALKTVTNNLSSLVPEEDIQKITDKIAELEEEYQKLTDKTQALKSQYDSLRNTLSQTIPINVPDAIDPKNLEAVKDAEEDAKEFTPDDENDPKFDDFYKKLDEIDDSVTKDSEDEDIEKAKEKAAELLKNLTAAITQVDEKKKYLETEVETAGTKLSSTVTSINEELTAIADASVSAAKANSSTQPTYRIGTLYADLQSVATSQATDLNRKFFRFSSDYYLAPTTGIILIGATKGKFDTSIHGVDIVEKTSNIEARTINPDTLEVNSSTTKIETKSYNYGVLSGKAVTRERHALIGFKTSVDEYNLGLGYSFIHGKVKAGNPSAYLANFADATYHADNFLVSLGRGYGDRYFTLGLFFSNFKYEVTHSTPKLSPLDYNFSAQQSKFNARMFGLDLSGAYKLHESERHLWTVDANLMLAKYSADAISETSLQTGKDALTDDQKMLAFKYKAHSGLIGNISLGTEYHYVYDIHTFTARLEANYRFANANKFKVELENNLAEAYSITKNFSARIGLGYSLEFIKDWKLKLSGALGIGTIKEKSWQLGLEAKF